MLDQACTYQVSLCLRVSVKLGLVGDHVSGRQRQVVRPRHVWSSPCVQRAKTRFSMLAFGVIYIQCITLQALSKRLRAVCTVTNSDSLLYTLPHFLTNPYGATRGSAGSAQAPPSLCRTRVHSLAMRADFACANSSAVNAPSLCS